MREKIKAVCPNHGEFYQDAQTHINGRGCPVCGNSIPREESEIGDWLEEMGFIVSRRNQDILPSGHGLDIYLPENKLAIEYNSLYWHSSQSSDNTIFIKNRLLNKLLKCQDLGIRLLQFWDCEWINKKDICKEIILFALGKIAKRIPAQKCTLKEISSKEANVFLKENHIQGRCRSNYRLGLSLNNQLVGIQCYQAPNPGGDSRNSWLIVRTAFLKNVQVIGGISRMFKKFIETIQPEQVVDYTDRRLFIASGHYAMKFNRLGVTRPCGYLTDGTSLYSRRHYRHWGKHHFRFKMPWDDALTDTENLANNGWWWVWDCGKIKNVWKRSL